MRWLVPDAGGRTVTPRTPRAPRRPALPAPGSHLLLHAEVLRCAAGASCDSGQKSGQKSRRTVV